MLAVADGVSCRPDRPDVPIGTNDARIPIRILFPARSHSSSSNASSLRISVTIVLIPIKRIVSLSARK
jgi:hypothetical protein